MKEIGRITVARATASAVQAHWSPFVLRTPVFALGAARRAHGRTARRSFAGIVVSLALALVVACGGGGDDGGEPDPTPVLAASATIGAAGGTLVGPDDVRVVVPAGALTADTVLTIRKSSAGAPALPASAASAAAMYEFTPHGLQFAVPATISMPSAVDPAIDPVLMAEAGQEWQRVEAARAGGRVSWPTTHFSWSYQYPCRASYPPGTPLPPNGPDCQIPSASLRVAATPAAALTAAPSPLPYQYRVVAGADVVVTLRYAVSLGCVNPTIRSARVVAPQSINPTTLPRTPVTLVNTPIAGIPGASQLVGSTDFSFRFTHADNGTVRAGFYFDCNGGLAAGGVAVFTVQVPMPPAAPAPPTAPVISQQPASASVQAGATATLNVLASAPDNLVVRWERREPGGTAFAVVPGAAPITGGSRVSLVAAAGDTGASYRARVCNVLNGQESCTLSSIAALIVTGAPPPPTTPLPPGGMLSGMSASSCAITSDRRLRCWGSNAYGGLGTGFGDDKIATPTSVLDLFDVTYVYEGLNVGCAVFDGGKSRCWGRFGSYGGGSPGPVPLDGSNDAVKVYADDLTVCTVRTDGHAYCNFFAGPMTADGRTIDGVVDVIRMGANFCALDGIGVLRCVAYDGNLGASVFAEPGVIALGRAATDTAVVCGVLVNGTVKCWGSDRFGQFGRGSANVDGTSGLPVGVTGAIAVAVGGRHACALRGDGRVLCWGSGFMGNAQAAQSAAAPALVHGLTEVKAISAGVDLTCALRGDGQVLCWGLNDSGQVGTGTVGGAVLAPTPTFAGAAFVH